MDATLDETRYDVVLYGTGLTTAILAAALSRAGKKVLHVDTADHYGTQWASMNLKEFHLWMKNGDNLAAENAYPQSFTRGSLYVCDAPDGSKIASYLESFASLLSQARSYSVDLSPRFILSKGPATQLLIQSNVGKYLEFRLIESTYMYQSAELGLRKVPLSKSDVFQATDLSFGDKRQLMKLVQLVSAHDPEAKQAHNASAIEKLSDESKQLQDFFDRPFVEYLNSQKVSPTVQSFMLYAVALAEYDQQASSRRLSTREAVDRINGFIKSLGRYGNGSFLFPLYGSGELPQGFSRLCAVFGGIYMLQSGFASLAVDKDTFCVKGVVSMAGQYIATAHVISEPHLLPSSMPGVFCDDTPQTAVGRAVAIIDKPLVSTPGASAPSPALIVIPPLSPAGNRHSVRILQLDPSFLVVPRGKMLLYLSSATAVADRAAGEADLKRVVDMLCNTNHLNLTTADFPLMPPDTRGRPVASPPAAAATATSASPAAPTPSVETAVSETPKEDTPPTPKPNVLYLAFYHQVVRDVQNTAAVPVESPVIPAPTKEPSASAIASDSDAFTVMSESAAASASSSAPKDPPAEVPAGAMFMPLSLPPRLAAQVSPSAKNFAPAVNATVRPRNLFVLRDPSTHLDYADEVQEAESVFRNLYPGLEFLPPEEGKKKPSKKTYFEDDPNGIGGLSDDDNDPVPPPIEPILDYALLETAKSYAAPPVEPSSITAASQASADGSDVHADVSVVNSIVGDTAKDLPDDHEPLAGGDDQADNQYIPPDTSTDLPHNDYHDEE